MVLTVEGGVNRCCIVGSKPSQFVFVLGTFLYSMWAVVVFNLGDEKQWWVSKQTSAKSWSWRQTVDIWRMQTTSFKENWYHRFTSKTIKESENVASEPRWINLIVCLVKHLISNTDLPGDRCSIWYHSGIHRWCSSPVNDIARGRSSNSTSLVSQCSVQCLNIHYCCWW